MTCNVLMGTLNPTHSLTHWFCFMVHGYQLSSTLHSATFQSRLSLVNVPSNIHHLTSGITRTSLYFKLSFGKLLQEKTENSPVQLYGCPAIGRLPAPRISDSLVLRWLGCWTCNQQVAGSNPSRPAVERIPGQVVNTHVCLCHRAV